MKEYYKIKYTIHGDGAKIRSLIMSCVSEDVAMDNFKMAFIGQSPSIVSIEWVPKPGSLVASALAPMEEPAPTAELVPMPEPEPEAAWGQPMWHKTA